ncbi:MAG: lamin tail domain-containing protein [bacterium]|nr:lamin tail domain-containing protein [bacterium]
MPSMLHAPLRLFVPALALGLLWSSIAHAQSLVFSEYVEGSGNNKAVEIQNAISATAVDLTDAQVEIYGNGSPTPTTAISLSPAMLQPGEVFVLANPNGTGVAPLADQTTTDLNFNGDDAVVLRVSGQIVDAIGQIGFDPGSEWSGNGVSTRDQTLVRSFYDCAKPHGVPAFDPSTEWDSVGFDDFLGLGDPGFGFATANCAVAPSVPTAGGLGRTALTLALLGVLLVFAPPIGERVARIS